MTTPTRTLADALADLNAAIDALDTAVANIPAANTVVTVDNPAAVQALDAANLRIAAAIAKIPQAAPVVPPVPPTPPTQ